MLAARQLGQAPDLVLIAQFWLGAVVMRGAGSTWNDIQDRKLDALVARTKARPLPAGEISVRAAFVFLLGQAGLGLCVLWPMGSFARWLGVFSLALVGLYPFMKRVTNYPQGVLGLTFAWGALMGFAAVMGDIPPAGIWLYAGAVLWVIGYDTIYALQDIEDDEIAGIGSTARAFKRSVREIVTALYAIAVICLLLALFQASAGWPSYLGLGGFALHLGFQGRALAPGLPAPEALRLFRANRFAGLILFFGLFMDAVLASL